MATGHGQGQSPRKAAQLDLEVKVVKEYIKPKGKKNWPPTPERLLTSKAQRSTPHNGRKC